MPWIRTASVLAAAFLSCATGPALAQHDHASHGAAAAPAVAASAPSARPARKPRPQLGLGAALAPDGALWWVGLEGEAPRLVLHRASAASTKALWAGAATGALAWESAQALDTAQDPISADGENHPKLLFGRDGVVLVAYTTPLTQHHAGHVRILRSTDGGKTFAPPVTLHADRQELTHRFESLAIDGKGVLQAVWIDSRDEAAAPRVNGKSSYRGVAIYTAASADGGATFGPDTKVADHSCECCRTATAVGTDGKVRALWRHVFEPNVRDHAIAVVDGTPIPAVVRATHDEWKVDGCPHHGPGLAAAEDGGFHAVWFGIRAGVAGVRYARLRADGSPLPATVQRLPDARAEHASVVAQGQQVAVVWRSSEGLRTSLKAWLSRDGGRTFTERLISQVDGENDFPRVAQQGERIAVLWRTPKEVQVHVLAF